MRGRHLAAFIDHTLLRPEAGPADIDRLCDEARRFGMHAVCVQPCLVRRAAERLSGSGVAVASVISFPHGASTTATKCREVEAALADGASELDVVANLGWIADGDTRPTEREVAAVVAVAGPALVKVILETGLFPDELRKTASARAAVAGGAAFVKTSTGFAAAPGATVQDVSLLRRAVPAEIGVKASGGIRTRAQAEAMLAAGATRLGLSASVAILNASEPPEPDGSPGAGAY